MPLGQKNSKGEFQTYETIPMKWKQEKYVAGCLLCRLTGARRDSDMHRTAHKSVKALNVSHLNSSHVILSFLQGVTAIQLIQNSLQALSNKSSTMHEAQICAWFVHILCDKLTIEQIKPLHAFISALASQQVAMAWNAKLIANFMEWLIGADERLNSNF